MGLHLKQSVFTESPASHNDFVLTLPEAGTVTPNSISHRWILKSYFNNKTPKLASELSCFFFYVIKSPLKFTINLFSFISQHTLILNGRERNGVVVRYGKN